MKIVYFRVPDDLYYKAVEMRAKTHSYTWVDFLKKGIDKIFEGD